MGRSSEYYGVCTKMSPHRVVKDKTPEKSFTGVKPDAGHLRIFGCPVYIDVPHEKRSKLDPPGKKGIFFGYSETSKGYRIYVPGHRQIDINRDVSFDEEVVFRRSHESPLGDDDEEKEAPIPEDHDHDHDHEEIHLEPISDPKPPREGTRKRPRWFHDTLQDAEGHTNPRGTFRESKRPQRYLGYSALMSHISDSEPSSFEEAIGHQVWKGAIMDEYQSIMMNDVWDIVSRPKRKSVVTSKWIFSGDYEVDL